jgi:hypothetical protein
MITFNLNGQRHDVDAAPREITSRDWAATRLVAMY